MSVVRRNFLLLVIVALVLYIPSWFNGFVWDDEEQIVNNPFIKSFQNVSHVFSGSTFGGGGSALPSGGYYKPLMSVWYMVNYALFGDWAGGFHLTQSVIHGVNAGLLYLLFRRFLKSDRWAFGGALIWLLHPGNVESVSYAASAQEVLASAFGLLSLIVVVYRRKWRVDEITSLFLAAGLILPALLSKEAGAVFPLVITAYLVVIERKFRLAKFYWMMLLPVIVVYAVLRFGVAGVFIEPNPIIPVAQLAFGERMLTVVETLWQHIRVTFLPFQLYIGHHQVVTQFSWRTGWQLAVIVGLLGGMGYSNYVKAKNAKLKTRGENYEMGRVGWFFWIWLVLATGLVSNVIALDMTYAERWSYMPIAAMVGWIAIQIHEIRNKKYDRVGRFLVLGLVVLLVGRNVVRQVDWKDGLTLFSKDVAYARNSFDLENNLGVELMRVGRVEEAGEHFERSIELSPGWWTPPNNLGVIYQRMGDVDRAIELYRLSITNGHYFLAYENLAVVLIQEERFVEAAEVVEEGLKRFPYNQTLLEAAMWLAGNRK
jgi:tetratricopeptide (TPR) repeat protein